MWYLTKLLTIFIIQGLLYCQEFPRIIEGRKPNTDYRFNVRVVGEPVTGAPDTIYIDSIGPKVIRSISFRPNSSYPYTLQSAIVIEMSHSVNANITNFSYTSHNENKLTVYEEEYTFLPYQATLPILLSTFVAENSYYTITLQQPFYVPVTTNLLISLSFPGQGGIISMPSVDAWVQMYNHLDTYGNSKFQRYCPQTSFLERTEGPLFRYNNARDSMSIVINPLFSHYPQVDIVYLGYSTWNPSYIELQLNAYGNTSLCPFFISDPFVAVPIFRQSTGVPSSAVIIPVPQSVNITMEAFLSQTISFSYPRPLVPYYYLITTSPLFCSSSPLVYRGRLPEAAMQRDEAWWTGLAYYCPVIFLD